MCTTTLDEEGRERFKREVKDSRMAEGDPNIGKKDIYRGDLIILSTPDDPMPTLYHYDGSYFSQVIKILVYCMWKLFYHNLQRK